MVMDRHVSILGGLYLVLGLSGVIGIPFVLGSMIGGGLATGEWGLMLFVPALGVTITILMVLFAVPTLVAGVALLRGARWARSFGLFVAALSLINFPFGTPIGAYGLWVLSRRSSEPLSIA
jgi:hypothetical protein